MSQSRANQTITPGRIEANAPTRIDLAGGTIDLWPLYLLLQRPLTVNAAIDLLAHVVIETTPGAGVEVISHDRERTLRVNEAGALAAAVGTAPDELELVIRLAAHFLAPEVEDTGGPGWSCRISTDCRAPAGSGLGGSSSLAIALSAALNRYTSRGLTPDRLLHLARAIETQVLRIPTGEQDYHAALRGGVLALHYTVEGTRVERLPVDLGELARRTILVDTGVSRSSGISNWDMIKRHLDGDAVVREALERVNRASHAMRGALLGARWDAVGEALAEEWEARKRLSPAVSTAEIDALIAAARSAGALAGKICGAGGGGCLALWVREGCREAVSGRIGSLGARILDFTYTLAGVQTRAF